MTNTRPIHASNALDQVAIAVVFESDFDQAFLEKTDFFRSLFADRLPCFNPLKFLQMQLDDPAASLSGIGGFECTSNPDPELGKPVWSLKVDKNSIVVTCSKFNSWTQLWDEVNNLLVRFLSQVDPALNKIKELVLQCADIFLCEVPFSSGQYDISGVFNIDSIYLSKSVQSYGASWHLHQGWFSSAESYEITLLHNLNISAIEKSDGHMTVIDHVARIRSESVFPKIENALEVLSGKIASIMRFAYDQNIEVMKALLSNQMQKDIGLI